MIKILKLKQIDSTNDFAKQLLRLYPPQELNNTVICAINQTNGRGADNSKWIAQPGKNLTFSIIHVPDYLYIDELFYLSKAVSLGIHSFLESIGIQAKIKWPNDILVDHKKIAGILIENAILGSKIKHSIIGVGLNVNQTQFPEGLNATSIKLITGKDYDLSTALTQLLERIFFSLEQLSKGKFKQIDQQYLKNLYLYQKEIKFRRNGQILKGIITGVDHFGRLQIQLPERQLFYAFNPKDIELMTGLNS